MTYDKEFKKSALKLSDLYGKRSLCYTHLEKQY